MAVAHMHRWRSTGHPGNQVTQRCEDCGAERRVDRAQPAEDERRELLALDARCTVQRSALQRVLRAGSLDAAKAAATEGLKTGGRVAA